MIMNKIFKNALVAFVAIMGLTMTSCVNKYEYSGATDEGSKVFFGNDLASTVDVSFDDNKFQVAVSRTNTAGELTVPVNITMSEGSIFTPSANSVTFADGEATTYLTFTYDPANIEYGKYDDIKVQIDDASLASTYGLSTYAFKAGKTEWKLMEKNNGKGTYRDDLMTTFGAETQIINVKIYESVVTAGKYMVEAPYDPEGDFGKNKMWSSVDEAKEEYKPSGNVSVNLVIDASDPKYVWFPEFDSGYSYGDKGQISFLSYVQYYMDNGYDLDFLKPRIPQYFGKMEDGVITMPAGSVLYAFGGEPWNVSNGNGLFAIALPGAVIGDFSLTADYTGIFTNPKGQVFAVAEVKLGDDATNSKAVVMSADVDASAVADAIAAGELEGIEVVDGTNNVPIPEDLSGKLQIIFVVMNGKSVKTVVSVPFEYYGGEKNPWKSLGQGYFVDDMILPLFGYAPDTYPVDIEESTDTPGLYRLVKMYSAVAADFGVESGTGDVLIHAENPNAVYIPLQPLELTLGKNGPFSLSTDAGELVEKYGFDAVFAQLPNIFGKLADGVITFPVLEGKNSADEPVNYQTWIYLGDKAYFGGRNGAFQIILPGVQAQSMKRAADFSRRLNGGKMKNAVMPSKISLKNKFFGLSIVK